MRQDFFQPELEGVVALPPFPFVDSGFAFTAADGTILPDHSPSGVIWNDPANLGNLSILANEVTNVSGATAGNVVANFSPGENFDLVMASISGHVPNNDEIVAVNFNMQDSGIGDGTTWNGYGLLIYRTGGNNFLLLAKWTNGSLASLGFEMITVAPTDFVGVRKVGGTFRLYISRDAGNTFLALGVPIVDGSYSGGRVGLFMNNQNFKVDVLVWGTLK